MIVEAQGLHITTSEASGWWRPLVEDHYAKLWVWCQPPDEDVGLSEDYPYCVEPPTSSKWPPTLFESLDDLGSVLRYYCQNSDKMLANLIELHISRLD